MTLPRRRGTTSAGACRSTLYGAPSSRLKRIGARRDRLWASSACADAAYVISDGTTAVEVTAERDDVLTCAQLAVDDVDFWI